MPINRADNVADVSRMTISQEDGVRDWDKELNAA